MEAELRSRITKLLKENEEFRYMVAGLGEAGILLSGLDPRHRLSRDRERYHQGFEKGEGRC